MSAFTEKIAAFCDRHPSFSRVIAWGEDVVKKPIFGCQSCGQCELSQNAFVCCMRCPKQLRNGPCGGTREDGHCEVYPDRLCIWWQIYTRSKRMGWQKKMMKYRIPVDRRKEHTSAWISMFAGRIEPLAFDNGDKYEQEAREQERVIREHKEAEKGVR